MTPHGSTQTASQVPVPLSTALAEHAQDHDALSLDLWGTLHDGIRPLPGVLACVAQLKTAGKRLLILSNAPRRNDAVIARMRHIGLPDDAYDGVLSSGEAVWQALRDRPDPWHQALGRRCYVIGGTGDDSAVSGLDIEQVEDMAAADFVVCVGIDHSGATVAEYEDVMAAARGRSLPMICANPDLEVLRGEAREICAGSISARYEEMGGNVFYHGKPYGPIYETALRLLDLGDGARVLAVGDSLRTDIAGAAKAGLDSLLVTGGIHAVALGIGAGATPDPARLAALCAELGARPTAAIAAFRW